MRTVHELKGFKSLRALNVFSTLVIGLKMLPAYAGYSYEDFLAKIQDMTEDEQRKILTEAALFVQLDEDEVKSLICFCEDKNGVRYSAENIKSLSPDELIDIIVSVCMQISKIKIDLVSSTEKKN